MRFERQRNLLKNLRRELKFTQAEVAKKCGFSTPQMIANIEGGASGPSFPVLKFMSKHIDIDSLGDAMIEDADFEIERMLVKLYKG